MPVKNRKTQNWFVPSFLKDKDKVWFFPKVILSGQKCLHDELHGQFKCAKSFIYVIQSMSDKNQVPSHMTKLVEQLIAKLIDEMMTTKRSAHRSRPTKSATDCRATAPNPVPSMNNVVECLISCSLSQYKLNSFTTELAIESALNEIYLIVNPFAKPVNVINLV